jgi:hypothetical protein
MLTVINAKIPDEDRKRFFVKHGIIPLSDNDAYWSILKHPESFNYLRKIFLSLPDMQDVLENIPELSPSEMKQREYRRYLLSLGLWEPKKHETVEKVSEQGFVFADGKVLNPPYKLTVENYRLSINGYTVYDDARIFRKYQREVVYKKPEEIETDKNGEIIIRNSNAVKRIGELKTFIQLNYIDEIALETLRKELLEYQSVKKVYREPVFFGNMHIRIEEINGTHFGLNFDMRMPPLITEKELENMVLGLYKHQNDFHRQLENEDCLLFFSGGRIERIDSEKVPIILPSVVEILESEKTKKEKSELLLAIGVIPVAEQPVYDIIIDNYETNDEFIRRLIKISGAKQLIDLMGKENP